MKAGKREEAEQIKKEVAILKEKSKELQEKSEQTNTELNSLLVLLPIPLLIQLLRLLDFLFLQQKPKVVSEQFPA